jgi:hypothetical protein
MLSIGIHASTWKAGRFGYALGGSIGAYSLVADCTTFATQSTAALASANLSLARRYPASFSDGARFGYTVGGNIGGGTPYSLVADCTTFATRSTAALASANLSLARDGLAGFSDGARFGYTVGGNIGGGTPYSLVADCTTFATQATAALTSANLSLARYGLASFSDGARFGYTVGGTTGANSLVADCTTFATQSTAALASANLSLARRYPAGFSDGARFGYTVGGFTGNNSLVADCTTFATQATAALTSANLSLARYGLASFSDGARFGYTVGGYADDYSLVADCTTFATQTTAALTSANLSLARYDLAGFSDYNV